MTTICIFAFLCFKLIPTEYQSYSNLYQHFSLSDSIIRWEAGWCDLSYETPKLSIKFCSDTLNPIDLPQLTERNTYSSNYHNAFLNRDFIFYMTKSGKIKFVKEVEDLPTFIGTVDNLEEALFLANIYGYGAKTGKKYGSYKVNNGSYTLKLYKIVDPPDVIMEGPKPIRSEILVNSNGEVFEVVGSKSRRLSVKDMHRNL